MYVAAAVMVDVTVDDTMLLCYGVVVNVPGIVIVPDGVAVVVGVGGTAYIDGHAAVMAGGVVIVWFAVVVVCCDVVDVYIWGMLLL